jgi:hypothetical protein
MNRSPATTDHPSLRTARERIRIRQLCQSSLHFDVKASAVRFGVYDDSGHQPPNRFDQFRRFHEVAVLGGKGGQSFDIGAVLLDRSGMQCDDIGRVGAFQLAVYVGALDFKRLDPRHQGGEVDALRAIPADQPATLRD